MSREQEAIAWKPVAELDGYEISSHGILRAPDGSLVKQCRHVDGYVVYYIRRKYCLAHRLVAKAFIPNPHNKPQVNHKNSKTNDNRVENLEWATAYENAMHGRKFGNRPVGEGHPRAKLTQEQVDAIKASVVPGRKLAKLYGVHQTTIDRIKSGVSYGQK